MLLHATIATLPHPTATASRSFADAALTPPCRRGPASFFFFFSLSLSSSRCDYSVPCSHWVFPVRGMFPQICPSVRTSVALQQAGIVVSGGWLRTEPSSRRSLLPAALMAATASGDDRGPCRYLRLVPTAELASVRPSAFAFLCLVRLSLTTARKWGKLVVPPRAATVSHRRSAGFQACRDGASHCTSRGKNARPLLVCWLS